MNVINTTLTIDSGSASSVTGNDFTYGKVVATGPSTGTIDLSNNWWGTTDPTAIANKITDHSDNSSLPTVNFNPPLSSASPAGTVSATLAANEFATFKSSAQNVSLSATVTSGSTNINEGNVTFTVLSGINIIGTPVMVGVSSGVASTSNYAITAGTAAGTYTIEAIYYGTGNYLGSIDASHTLTISAATTTTAAQNASTTYSSAPQSVPLTASISSSAGAVNGGAVTFTILNNGTTIATATSGTIVGGNASATVTLPAGTAVNTYTIQAVYSGTGNFGTSTDSMHSLTVYATSTSTALSSSANPSVYGQAVTFTAIVTPSSPGYGTPTGSVTFKDGTTVLGTQTLSGEAATFTISSLALGSHSITAVYGGSTTFSGSTSTAVAQAVNQDATTSLVFSSVNPSASGQPVVFTAVEIAVSPGTGTPTGTVTFKDGTTALATEPLSGGTATYLDTSLANGTHSITVVYGGDANFKSSTSSVLTQLVGVSPATATFLKADATTSGNWSGTYGANGTDIQGYTAALPSYATVSFSSNATPYTWATGSTDPRAPQNPANPSGTRTAAAWYNGSGTSFTATVDLTDGQQHDLELYFLDWAKAGRVEQVQIADAASGTVLDTETVSSFGGGTYLDWKVSGDLVITITAKSGANAVLTGLFFDPPTSPSGATATFLKTDATTSGSWSGTYGANGTDIQGYTAALPSYATVSFSSNATPYTWATGSTDPRAPQNPANPSGTRTAAAWYNGSGTSFTAAVDLTDGQQHDLELYFLDWAKAGRVEQVQIADAASGTVLDTETVSSFGGGTYLDWKVSGDLVITITAKSGANAVLTGLFFDPPTSTTAASLASSRGDVPTSGSSLVVALPTGISSVPVVGRATSPDASSYAVAIGLVIEEQDPPVAIAALPILDRALEELSIDGVGRASGRLFD